MYPHHGQYTVHRRRAVGEPGNEATPMQIPPMEILDAIYFPGCPLGASAAP